MHQDLGLDGGCSAWFSESEGVLVVSDRELFRPGFERFCRRLADRASRLGGVRSSLVCLTSGTCRLDFEGGRFAAAEMAEWFAEAVRNAIESAQAPEAGQGGWTSLISFAADQGGSTWETTRQGRNSLRLRHRGLAADRGLAHRVAAELAGAPGILSCRVGLWSRDLDLEFDPEALDLARALAAVNAAYQRTLRPPQAPVVSGSPADATNPPVATGLERVKYLALAGGSFALTVVGLVVPGVPTVPFLLATSYYLVRSSPALNEKLLRSRFFGPILTDLEYGHGLRRINKIKLVAFTLTVGLATVLVIAPGWPILILMAGVTTVSLVAIGRIPALPSPAEVDQPPRLKLLTA